MLAAWLPPEPPLGERGSRAWDHPHVMSSVPSHIAEGLNGRGAGGGCIAVKDDSFLCNERGRGKIEVTGHQGGSVDSDSNAVEATFISPSIVCWRTWAPAALPGRRTEQPPSFHQGLPRAQRLD